MYKNFLNNFLLQGYESYIRKRKTFYYKKFLDQSQWWSKDEIRTYQWQALKKLLEYAYQEAPYYRRLLTQRGLTPKDIQSFNDFTQLPLLTKDIIRQRKDDLVIPKRDLNLIPEATGGSTGKPLQFYLTRDNYDWQITSSSRGYGWAGCNLGTSSFYIWGAPIKPLRFGERIKIALHNYLLCRTFVNSFQFTPATMQHCLVRLNREKPKVIIGYTKALLVLAAYMKQNGFRLSFRPSAIITAAEPLYQFQRESLKDSFGCEIFNSYGSREFMLIAMECEYHQGLHLSSENLYVECVPDENGFKKIVITDLHNYGMPFIRYEIGDLGEFLDTECPCGRGLPLLKAVQGRILDQIITTDGTVVPGEFFPHLMKEYIGVKEFQVVQEEDRSIKIKLVKSNPCPLDTEEQLLQEIRKVLGERMDVSLQWVDQIPFTPSGKFRVTVSKCLGMK